MLVAVELPCSNEHIYVHLCNLSEMLNHKNVNNSVCYLSETSWENCQPGFH